jgi:hypothetical protein
MEFIMAKVTVNDKAVMQDGLAQLISQATKTQGVGDTVLAVLPLLGVMVDLETMTATCPNIDALRKMAKPDSLVHVDDGGKAPRPRQFTWQTFIKRLEVAVRIAPFATVADTIAKEVAKDVITFEATEESAGKSTRTLNFAGQLD